MIVPQRNERHVYERSHRLSRTDWLKCPPCHRDRGLAKRRLGHQLLQKQFK